MREKKLRVVLLTHGGCEKALERLLALDAVEVAGVFIETDVIRRCGLREKMRRSIRYDGYWATAGKLTAKLAGFRRSQEAESLEQGRDAVRKLAEDHNVPVHSVADFHSESSLALLRAAKADLGVVLGTNILKESVFKTPRLGSINLHQGLAPYYRGCPAVFWELFNGEREVGLTVHFVESKVDTGEIILQRVVPLEYDYSYGMDFDRFINDYRAGLVGRCAQLVADAVKAIAEGTASPRPQDTSLGKRYRLPVKKEKDEMRRRLRQRRQFADGRLSPQRASEGRL
ncbi:MAG TPA: formyltransferase family protein [Blastocatellia bacterium]|nr:formyltransferase family protein [Blastocatellia bacterium]